MKLTITTTEKKEIKDFKEKLFSKLKDEIVSLYLFGSKARGDSHQDSDIDILAILKQPTQKQINYIYECATMLSGKYRNYLSVKVFSEKEFDYYKSVPTLFAKNIIREGVAI